MNDSHDDYDTVPLEIIEGIFETFFRMFVENGDIDVSDRSPEEIFGEFDALIFTDLLGGESGEPQEIPNAIDYRDSLLLRARKEAQDNNNELAVTFYATWLEHFVNGILTRALERMGHGDEVSSPLIKDLHMPAKVTALWKIAELPALDQDCIKLMMQISEHRNSFVHYKWRAHKHDTIEANKERVATVAAQAEHMVSALQAVESSVFWNGRDTELIGILRANLKKRWEVNPLKLKNRRKSEDA